ncbi:DUF805 domain-containing protein [Promicromonospora sp. NFX87]|jgi:uncharacterized membrane protein YhaH (DUF805 family)|uniref:DUF805 domain-containing protein n=1 Tax=Promicromonospora sp. NFX87 TaxID=3402691 RepID=UPI003AFB4B01
MSFIESIKTVLSNYAVFNGRARRSEYWWYTLAVTIVSTILYVVLVVPGLSEYTAATMDAAMTGSTTVPAMPGSLTAGYAVLSIFNLALLLPGLGVTVRRLHDTDRSGFWVFLGLVPVVGGIILIVWEATAGTPGPNRFGPDPKAVAQPAAA